MVIKCRTQPEKHTDNSLLQTTVPFLPLHLCLFCSHISLNNSMGLWSSGISTSSQSRSPGSHFDICKVQGDLLELGLQFDSLSSSVTGMFVSCHCLNFTFSGLYFNMLLIVLAYFLINILIQKLSFRHSRLSQHSHILFPSWFQYHR